MFEKYCRNLYGEDTDDWVQVLPSYLRGELRQVAQVLGASVGYDEVKQKLLSEFVVETGVTGKLFTDLLDVTLKENESLKCFLIRLQSMAIKIPADDGAKDALILTALRRNLDTQILYQIDLQLGTQSVSPKEFVQKAEAIIEAMKAAKVLTKKVPKIERILTAEPRKFESGEENAQCKQNSAQGFQCYNCEEYCHIARNCPKNSSLRCNGCGKMGHMLRNCVNKNCNTYGRMYGVTCGFCGVHGHAMMNCKDFVEFRSLLKENAVERKSVNTVNTESLKLKGVVEIERPMQPKILKPFLLLRMITTT